MKYSVIVPVYKNEDSIERLRNNLESLSSKIQQSLEVIFVVDGSPDKSYEILKKLLPQLQFKAKLIIHSKNFGSFAAIKSGLKNTDSDFSATYAADCQEPIGLIEDFFASLEDEEIDIVFGTRKSREDRFWTKFFSNFFWSIYRVFVDSDMPKGGVDTFGCTKGFREELIKLEESRSSLIALAYWLGFERKTIEYHRFSRQEGRSAWSWRKKINYLLDSLFSFTDLPIKVLLVSGVFGILLSFVLGILVLVLRLIGDIEIPGYSPTILLILFFGALNIFGLGLVGSYSWRAYENSKNRPSAIISRIITN